MLAGAVYYKEIFSNHLAVIFLITTTYMRMKASIRINISNAYAWEKTWLHVTKHVTVTHSSNTELPPYEGKTVAAWLNNAKGSPI